MLRHWTKEILERYGIRLSKRRDQHHLVDEKVLERIIDYANISEKDVVLEIGSGLGNLTNLLVKQSKKIIAVEKDEKLVQVLQDRLGSSPHLKIICGDILKIELPEFDKVVSNLPYSLSSEITFRLLETQFKLGVLTYQKEFAQRMVASPGYSDYSRLTIAAYYRTAAKILEKVPPTAFLPSPEVESAVVKLRRRNPPFHVKDEDLFYRMLRAVFQHRRKTIRNALYHGFEIIYPDLEVPKYERKAFIDRVLPRRMANSRPENLTPEKLGELANILSE